MPGFRRFFSRSKETSLRSTEELGSLRSFRIKGSSAESAMLPNSMEAVFDLELWHCGPSPCLLYILTCKP